MYDEPSRLINAVRKAAPEQEHVHPPLDLAEHQAAHGRHALLLFLLQPLPLLLRIRLSSCKQGKLVLVVAEHGLLGPHIGQGGRQVPALEDLLVDVVAVVAAHEPLRRPALLEERRAGVLEAGHPRLDAASGLDSVGKLVP